MVEDWRRTACFGHDRANAHGLILTDNGCGQKEGSICFMDVSSGRFTMLHHTPANSMWGQYKLDSVSHEKNGIWRRCRVDGYA